MEIVSLLFRQNVIMFLYLFIGYILYKKKVITAQGSGEIGKLLLYVIMPAAIIKSYIKDYSKEMLAGFLVSFLAALGALLLAMLISRLVFRRKSAIRQFGAAFSNAGGGSGILCGFFCGHPEYSAVDLRGLYHDGG